jgi:membrane-associated phospholipid phosphatase
VLSTTLLLTGAWTLGTPQAWRWAGFEVCVAVLAPLLYLAWLVRHGRVTDLDVQLREQRARPMLFTLGCGALGLAVLALGGAPPLLVTLAGGLWAQMVIILSITLYWKISVHSATAAAAATALLVLFGTPLPWLVGVPLIAWARVRLGRHTLAQTVFGALLGTAILGWALL